MAEDQTPADETFDNLADLLDALRGEGWVAADIVKGHGREQLGFRLDGYEVTRRAYELGHCWAEKGSWTTGAGDGYRVYRGRVAGHLVDWVDASQWPNTRQSAFMAVHDSDTRDDGTFPENRQTGMHDWKHGWGEGGYRKLDDILEGSA